MKFFYLTLKDVHACANDIFSFKGNNSRSILPSPSSNANQFSHRKKFALPARVQEVLCTKQ